MAPLTPQRFSTWSPAHQAAVLGSQATAYGQATGKAKVALLASAYRGYRAKAAAAASLPHPGYTNSQFGTLVNSDPNLVQLRQQNAQNAQKRANIGSYYDAYRQALKDAQDQSNAGYAQAGAQNQQTATAASNLDTQQASDLLKAAQADAAQRGETVNPQLAAMLANASASRNTQMNQFGSLIGALGANENSYLGTRGANTVGGKVQALLNNQQQQNALSRGYGQQKSATALKLSSSLQSAATDAALKQAALGETATKDATTAANQQASLALRQQTEKSTAHDRAVRRRTAAQKAAYQRAHHTGPYKPVSSPSTKGALNPKQQLDQVGKIGSLPKLINAYLNTADPKTGKKPNRQQVEAGLIQKGYQAWMITAAEDLQKNGSLSQGTIHLLHEHGIHKIPDSWLHPKPKATNSGGIYSSVVNAITGK